jgi:hypothetical protein
MPGSMRFKEITEVGVERNLLLFRVALILNTGSKSTVEAADDFSL